MKIKRAMILVIAAIVTGAIASLFIDKVLVYFRMIDPPIVFYGKIVDTDGNPLSDVNLTIWAERSTGMFSSRTYRYQRQTDERGMFSYSGDAAKSVGASGITKQGYTYLSGKTSYDYTKMSTESLPLPDQNNPLVITMWKLKGAQPMYYWDKDFHYPADGTPVYIDLEKAEIVKSGGDLKVTFIRDPVEVASDNFRFKWHLKIEVVDGGLIEKDEKQERLFEVPADGYQPFFEAGGDLRDNQDKYFIFKSRNGKNHGKMFLRYRTGNKDGSIGVRVYLNPNSSRNLEYAPNLQINGKSERPTGY